MSEGTHIVPKLGSMKALTLTQPWATLVAIGAKRIETRSWRTPYRGPLAIHAAKGFPRWAKETCSQPGFSLALAGEPIPTGVVIATCTLVDCIPTAELQTNGRGAALMAPIFHSAIPVEVSDFEMTDQERLFGDYSPGRWAWILADIFPLPAPVSAKGALGLWEWH